MTWRRRKPRHRQPCYWLCSSLRIFWFQHVLILAASVFDVQFLSGEIFSRWRHQMDIFSALLALCAGNSPITGEFPSQRPVTPWRQCPTYDRDVVSYRYLRLCNLCRPPSLTSDALCYVCSVAYLFLCGHFKGRNFCLWLDTISSCILPWNHSHIAFS